MENKHWGTYVEQTKEKPPRPLLVKAIQYLENKNQALDVGAGALNDSKFLLKKGFAYVTAIDQSPIAQEIADSLPRDRFTYVISKIEDMEISSETYDLVNAQFSLPFIGKESFKKVWSSLSKAIEQNGIFCGQLFGTQDTWNTLDSNLIFHTRKEVEDLIAPFEIIFFEEKENDGVTAAGIEKHWHLFNFILRKK